MNSKGNESMTIWKMAILLFLFKVIVVFTGLFFFILLKILLFVLLLILLWLLSFFGQLFGQ